MGEVHTVQPVETRLALAELRIKQLEGTVTLLQRELVGRMLEAEDYLAGKTYPAGARVRFGDQVYRAACTTGSAPSGGNAWVKEEPGVTRQSIPAWFALRLGKAVCGVIADAIAPLLERIAALEAAQQPAPPPSPPEPEPTIKVFDWEEGFHAGGQVVRYANRKWLCCADVTRAAPSAHSPDWRLL